MAKKSARSRSSIVTNTTRHRPSTSARSQRRVVCTSTPLTPLTAKSAPSTTRSEASVSAWKPGSPGVSTRLILRSCHSCVADRGCQRHLPPLLVLVPVGDGRGALDRAQAVGCAGLEEQSPRPARSFQSLGGRRRRRSGSCSARTAARVGEFTDLPALSRKRAGRAPAVGAWAEASRVQRGRPSPTAGPSGGESPSCGAGRRETPSRRAPRRSRAGSAPRSSRA